jgi:hypothetical protein
MRRRKLDERLAAVRALARQIAMGEITGDVPLLNAGLAMERLLEGAHWNQRRYPHFVLSEEEYTAVRLVVSRPWRISGEQTSAEIVATARTLVNVGMSRPLA